MRCPRCDVPRPMYMPGVAGGDSFGLTRLERSLTTYAVAPKTYSRPRGGTPCCFSAGDCGQCGGPRRRLRISTACRTASDQKQKGRRAWVRSERATVWIVLLARSAVAFWQDLPAFENVTRTPREWKKCWTILERSTAGSPSKCRRRGAVPKNVGVQAMLSAVVTSASVRPVSGIAKR